MPGPGPQISLSLELELLGRLALAVLLASVIGLERELARHAAGLRTHVLVALGAAAFTIAGTFGVGGSGTGQDAGRVAAQVVSGIGFIGAGTIWRSTQRDGQGGIYGLTTAATIWVAAAIGMLCGFGLYVLAAGSAILGLVVLRAFRLLERKLAEEAKLARQLASGAKVSDGAPVRRLSRRPVGQRRRNSSAGREL